ncbi:MAG TPA: uL15 family ribosomal protein [Candidatus Nanoarchaeia archaeon]|nr:uL15 family ribosomal protein [Candidatus Nanoarchaeia archaeon]
MVIRKRKKNSRQRGSWTHGWGAKKKHRGSGHRGGKGMAGTGKRADSKKPSIWKDVKYFGKHGFVMHGAKFKANPINILDIEEHVSKWISEKKASESKGEVTIDLGALGYNKLLGNGKPTRKYVINVQAASKGAVESIQEAGGKVNVSLAGPNQ